MKSIRVWNTVLAASLLVAAGCGESDPTDVVFELPGSYELTSITYEGLPAGTPPYVTGTLTLTEAGYAVQVDAITLEGPTQIIDEGSYSVEGDSWIQTSTMDQPASVGTYSFDGVVLSFDVTVEEARVLSNWRRMN